MTWGALETTAGGESRSRGACSAATGMVRLGVGPWRLGIRLRAVNVVWGPTCGGADCAGPWTGDTVWGTSDEGDTVVWGTADEGDTVVWGTADGRGHRGLGHELHATPRCEPVIWKSP